MIKVHSYDYNYLVIFNDEVHVFSNLKEAQSFYRLKKGEADEYDLVEFFQNRH